MTTCYANDIMTKQNKIITVIVFTLLVIMLAASALMMHSNPPKEGDMVACTMDALVCPDGSAVGRSGPSCAFSACPSSGSLTGVYLSDEQGARLVVAAPEGIGSGTSYAVPLATSSVALDASLIGTTVTLEGNFTDGATFRATGVTENSDDNTPTAPSTPPTSNVTLPKAMGKCYVGGCSAQLCSDQPDMISNCMYSPEYACYKTATCERQTTGECGWTPTNELSMCLKQNAATTQAPAY